MTKAQPNAALSELLARDGELDRILEGRGLTFEPAKVTGSPVAVIRRFEIPPADWDQERLERETREREQRVQEAAALLESVVPPPRPDAPARPSRRWRHEAA